ncbi:large exoprotein [Microbacterium sp. 2FI]|uniref:large exoprotein n=1 Tax=Microbacterium sp. 2FI TaxID=2502193 RepID=UPI0014850D69|nr:large exoprotein [Microbacterium sp. 2FI]
MSDYDGFGAMVAFWLVFLPILIVLSLAGYVIGSFFLMKVFDKAGVQGRWRAWVPVYNTMVFAKLGDLSPWVMLGAVAASAILGQVPAIGWILSLAALAVGVMASWRVGLKLGQEWPLLLLWLIPGLGPIIWLGILAFGASTWNPNVAPSPWQNSFLKDTTVWQGIPVQPAAAAAGPPAGGAYPPAGYPAPGAQPPVGPTGYAPPAPPSGYGAPTPPPAAPPSTTPPPAAPEPPTAPPAAPEPPITPEPPAAPEPPKP